MVLVLALRRGQLVDHRLDLVIADVDHRLDALAQQLRPGELAANLVLDRLRRRPRLAQEVDEGRVLVLEVRCDAVVRAVDLGIGDLDVLACRLLDLELLVDQVAQHLEAQARFLLLVDLAAVGRDDEVEPLLDVGVGDDVAVDDRRCLAQVRVEVGERGGVGQDERRVGRIVGLGRILGEQRCRHPNPGENRQRTQSHRHLLKAPPPSAATTPMFNVPSTLARRVAQRDAADAAPGPLNRRLAAEVLERDGEDIAVAGAEIAVRGVVAPPRNAEAEAFVLVLDADAVADRLIAAGRRRRLL